MDTFILLPILLPMAAGVLSALAGARRPKLREGLVVGTGIAVFALTVFLALEEEISLYLPGICGLGLSFQTGSFQGLYGVIAAFMWMMTGLFSPEYFAHHRENRSRYGLFDLLTLGATLGVLYSGDLLTTFLFFEIMSITSCVLVAHEQTDEAMKAAYTYLAVAVIGGMTTLMGLFLLYNQLGTLSFAEIATARQAGDVSLTVAAWLIVVGFAAKAGLYPLHIWMPKAYPVAPAPASALLSSILSKSGVFGLIIVCGRIMPGDIFFGRILMGLACVTMFLGALLALFSTDLKRTLACSSMSQIGFITVGLSTMVLLGEHGALAAYGSVMHMVSHSVIKLVLFMCAGVVYMNAHSLDLNEVRGFGRKKPVLHTAFLLGAVSIACIPPFGSGYNSKSLLHEGLLELMAHGEALELPLKQIEWLFLLSGGLTVAYMLKLYICLFWEKNPERQAQFDAMGSGMNFASSAAVLLSAAVLPFLGALPGLLLSPIGENSAAFFGQHPIAESIHYFSMENLKGAAVSITIGLAVYFGIVRTLMVKNGKYVDLWPKKLDLEDGLYRPVLRAVLAVTGVLFGFLACLPERIVLMLRRTVFAAARSSHEIPVGNAFTYYFGCILNGAAWLLNKTICRRKPLRRDFEYVLDASWKELRTTTSFFAVSVSYGLLLAAAGLIITVLYLLR